MVATLTTLVFVPVVFSLVHAWLAKHRPPSVMKLDNDIPL
jgi:hypothetical protein